MLRRHLPKRKPLYLQVDHLAPHTSPDPRLPCRRAAKPEPRDVGRFDKRSLGGPSFNEADLSDKNSGVEQRPLLDKDRIADMTRKYRCALASLVSVDRSVERIVKTVGRFRELSNTVFVFTSDNGYFYGEHRLGQKSLPYEEAARVPLMIRMPAKLRAGAPEGTVIDEPVANIDLAPTLLEIAGALPCRPNVGCRTLDGRSLMPLLRGNSGAWPDDRAIGLELRRRAEGQTASDQLMCSYRGLRTLDVAYFEFFNGATAGSLCPPETTPNAEPELYDLESDPFQLDADGFDRNLADRVRDLSECAGIQGRDPQPPSRHFCE